MFFFDAKKHEIDRVLVLQKKTRIKLQNESPRTNTWLDTKRRYRWGIRLVEKVGSKYKQKLTERSDT